MRQLRKPAWVVDELVRLKALMPKAGCRLVADCFNRRFVAKEQISVSKSYVAYTLRQRQYEIAEARRRIRRRQATTGPANHTWALDLTGKQDVHGQQHALLGLLDHGSRRLLALSAVPNKSAWTLLGYLFLAIGRFGKPRAIRSDNECIFTGKLFRTVLRLAGIRQQLSDPGCPWQNGRIERLFGTLKSKLDRWRVPDRAQLYSALGQFAFWYNAVRPHQNLNGRTPLEAWQGIDPYHRGERRSGRNGSRPGTGYCRVITCAISATGLFCAWRWRRTCPRTGRKGSPLWRGKGRFQRKTPAGPRRKPTGGGLERKIRRLEIEKSPAGSSGDVDWTGGRDTRA